MARVAESFARLRALRARCRRPGMVEWQTFGRARENDPLEARVVLVACADENVLAR